MSVVKARHLLIITTARCKSTIVSRLLAGEDWADLIIEPFTKAFYGPENVEYNSKCWPNNIELAKQLIYQRVRDSDKSKKPIVLKTLAYQSIKAFMDVDFLNYIKDQFYVLYLVRDPVAISKSIAHQLINRNMHTNNFVDYIGMSELYSLSLILPPNHIISVETDIDADPLTFIRKTWTSAGHPEIKINKLPNLPKLNQMTLESTGLNVWPSWYKRAINTVRYQPSRQNTPDHKLLPREYSEVLQKYIGTMLFYYDLLIQMKGKTSLT